jgi:hypothetical protein
MEERLRAAAPLGPRIIVQLTLDDVDDLAGHVAAEANHCTEPRIRRALEAVYDRLANIEARFMDEEGRPGAAIEEARPFRVKQGQYLAFIYYYTKITARHRLNQIFNGFFKSRRPWYIR